MMFYNKCFNEENHFGLVKADMQQHHVFVLFFWEGHLTIFICGFKVGVF